MRTIIRHSKYLFASEKFVPFNFKDPLNFESLLTEDEKMVINFTNDLR